MFVLMVVVEKVNQKGKGLKKFCLPSITTIKRPTNAAKLSAMQLAPATSKLCCKGNLLARFHFLKLPHGSQPDRTGCFDSTESIPL